MRFILSHIFISSSLDKYKTKESMIFHRPQCF
nr:MAG TPA: hypothetical protein [Caudoviricetes sp.]